MTRLNLKTATKVIPQCYAYTLPDVPAHNGWTKIGFTERDVNVRIEEQTHTAGLKAKLWWSMRAAYITSPYDTFTDKDFHAYLKKLGIANKPNTEWFCISPDKSKEHFIDYAQNHGVVSATKEDAGSVIPYKLREEQEEAVNRATAYFQTHKNGEFLWNAKPRFGKTLSAYHLCKQLQAKNVLIVTNRPAIANSWYSDYETFLGIESGYYFVSNVDGIKDRKYVYSYEDYTQKVIDDTSETIKGCIYFASLQDIKGSMYFGGQHDKLRELSCEVNAEGRRIGIEWDLLIIDEAHEGVDTYKTDTAFNKIAKKWTLHLSGTPFKALANDKFPEDAIYNWTYADEQKKKREWDSSSEEENPYEKLPRLSLFTYQMSDVIRDKVSKGVQLDGDGVEEFAFDLNEFFRTNENDKFVHEKEIDKFLDALTKQERFPFSSEELRNELKHTFWLLNRVSSVKALAKKLKIHPVFKDYEIIIAAGDGKLNEDDESEKSYDKVTKAIKENDKTITLSVGQLTTGITIPEWTAVLMLSNMASPSLYMQAAFRSQNPCLFTDSDGNAYRKQDAYVFDFDPARTLTIFEQFANDLIPETSGEKGKLDDKKKNVRELLNFFPVYAEDEEGSMIELDAEAVLTIPRHIHAKEVVERGFMSNFLFANISGIFAAPKEVIELINNMQPTKEHKPGNLSLDEHTSEELNLNDSGEVEIPKEQIIGTASNIFGEKVYGEVREELTEAVDFLKKEYEKKPNPKMDELQAIHKQLSQPIAENLINTARSEYGKEMKKSTQNLLEKKIKQDTDNIVNREYGDYKIRDVLLEKEQESKIAEAQKQGASMTELTRLDNEYQQKRQEEYNNMISTIQEKLSSQETISKAAETIVETIEKEKLNNEKDSIEGNVRDHLRGFTRTIPAFLMAYGDENTTLANFDKLVPEDVFWEVTVNPQTGKGVSMENFRFLRDGGDYYLRDEDGNEIRDEEHKRHYPGHLFDEVVFNDAVIEFMKRKEQLANYFKEDARGDIFDYIPHQQTNQIFTPKWVVEDMVSRLEEENPGCFDDPNNTFADLYMKSGMYITEIVKRLYRSETIKRLYPDEEERINHIFAKQVYGLAPTEIIYRICLSYILGFSKEIEIKKHNIKKCDSLEYAKNNTLAQKLQELFPELKN